MKLLTIYSFIVWLLWSCGIWFLVYLEFVGLCQCLLLSSLLASKVDLVTIIMEIYGLLFLIVWCGVFGSKEIAGVLKTMSILCLISSFFFFRILLDWFSVWRNQPFSSILDFLDLCNFCIWYVYPCILLVYLGVSFFYINKSLLLITKKKKKFRFPHHLHRQGHRSRASIKEGMNLQCWKSSRKFSTVRHF